MREIKFRAWDTEEERFIYSHKGYDDHWFQFEDSDSLKAFGLTEKEYGPPEERIHLRVLEEPQQYTGLHDKNDKEIYEGDIVECEDHDGLIQFSVFWLQELGAWGLLRHDKAISRAEVLFSFGPDVFEVIGNIYEAKKEEE